MRDDDTFDVWEELACSPVRRQERETLVRDPKCVGCGSRLLSSEADKGDKCAACSPKARAAVARRADKPAPKPNGRRYIPATDTWLPTYPPVKAIAATD
jgi:hypothetical protein